MTEPSNIYESIDEMVRLCHEKIRLMGELKRALMLADLIGKKPSEIKGTLNTRVVRGPTTFRPWKNASFWVREKFPDGTQMEMEFPLTEVPLDLWPDDILSPYLRFKAQEQRRVERLQNGNRP